MKKIKDLFIKLNEVKRWSVCIYYNGIKIKTKKVRKVELQKIDEKKFVINVYNKKQLFSAFKVNIVVRPVVLLYTDEKHRKIYVGVVIEEGVNFKN